MDAFFPLNNNVKKKKPVSLVITIIIYLVLPAILWFVQNLLGGVPIIGWVLSLISYVLGLYCLIGIILAIVKYVK